MITAEEFIRQYIRDIGGRDYTHEIIDVEDAIEALKEFSKEAIKADRINLLEHIKHIDIGSVNEDGNYCPFYIVDKDSLLNAPNIELL